MRKTGISDLKDMIAWLGFDRTNGKWGVMVIIYATVVSILIINSFYVIYKREEVDKKLDGLKGLVLYLMCLMYFIALTCDWDDQMLLLKTLEQGLYKRPYQDTEKQSRLEKSIQSSISEMNTIWYYGLNGYIILQIITPMVVFAFQVIRFTNEELSIDKLYLSLPFYFPKNHETIPVFILAFIFQSIFLAYGVRNGYLTLVLSFNSIQLIEGEIKVLRQSLVEMDYIIETNSNRFIQRTTPSGLIIQPADTFLKLFVQHHLEIYRKVKDVTKGIQLVAFSVNTGMSLLLCTAIYRTVTSNEAMVILVQEVIYGSILTFCLYCYGLMGEKVSSADTDLRMALYEYPWIDKPQWFKKSLQIIMTRANKTIEMNSLGLVTLNLRNFILTLRAAYSYFNLLNNLK